MAERIAYFDAQRIYPDSWDWLAEAHAEFWGPLDRETGERLIWLGSHSAAEASAYLAYLDRYSDIPAVVVRPDDYLPPHPKYGPVGAIGALTPEQLGETLDGAPQRSIAEDSALYSRWRELVAENAMLRVVENGRLVSAPIDYHDHFLLGAARQEWMRGVKVVGYALAASFDAQVWVNSDLLFARLGHLVESGALEADGDPLGWTGEGKRSEARVRLPA
jgi:hypothetical protein